VREIHISDEADQVAAKVRRRGHAPSRHDKLALAILSVPDDRRHVAGEDAGQ
jgi:hypothetical protein